MAIIGNINPTFSDKTISLDTDGWLLDDTLMTFVFVGRENLRGSGATPSQEGHRSRHVRLERKSPTQATPFFVAMFEEQLLRQSCSSVAFSRHRWSQHTVPGAMVRSLVRFLDQRVVGNQKPVNSSRGNRRRWKPVSGSKACLVRFAKSRKWGTALPVLQS